jgi:multisite-specific tRNA:(cytosine-C5)-methyltransferase
MDIGTSIDITKNSLDEPDSVPKKPKLDLSQPHFGRNAQSKENKTNTPGKEEPFTFLAPDHPELENIRAFFDLHPEFPTTDLFVRNSKGDPLNAIYITSSLVKDLMHRNPSAHILNAGVRLFSNQNDPKSGAKCFWRVNSDGLDLVDPFLGPKRVVYAEVDEIWELLKTGAQFPLVAGLKKGLREQISKLATGGFVVRIDPSKSGMTDMNVPFAIPMWKSPMAVK